MSNHNQTFTVSITVDDAKAALDYYQKALKAEVVASFEMPDGTLMHAELKFGETHVFLSGEFPAWKAFSPKTVGGSPNLLCLKDEDCDGLFASALQVGGEVISPVQDFPWGERAGVFADPFGYRWCISKTIEELSPEEIHQRMLAMAPPAE